MRMSCNGCRILRKGCTQDCIIRPCLEWIHSPDSQANATLFLAKFYGRAGLLNLINAAPSHHRPAIFRSLLYEACGRMINPIYGSVGLLWAGEWARCQSAVDAVLRGSPEFMNMPSLDSTAPHLRPCDIRRVRKSGLRDLRMVRTRNRFKRPKSGGAEAGEQSGSRESIKWTYPRPIYEETSQESLGNRQSAEEESSVENAEASFINPCALSRMLELDNPKNQIGEERGLRLELSLEIKSL